MTQVTRDRIAFMVPWLVLGWAGIWVALHAYALPARVPVHFDFSGRPNGWVENNLVALLWPIALAAAIVAALTWLCHRKLSGSTPADRALRNVLLAACVSVSCGFGFAALAPFWGPGPVIASVLVTQILLLTTIARAVTIARAQKGTLPVQHDPSVLWVPKRSGLGWTVNMAHPHARLVIVLLVVGPLALIGAMALLARP